MLRRDFLKLMTVGPAMTLYKHSEEPRRLVLMNEKSMFVRKWILTSVTPLTRTRFLINLSKSPSGLTH